MGNEIIVVGESVYIGKPLGFACSRVADVAMIDSL
jgi:hypothetical protein